jgi:hypothetical protein
MALQGKTANSRLAAQCIGTAILLFLPSGVRALEGGGSSLPPLGLERVEFDPSRSAELPVLYLFNPPAGGAAAQQPGRILYGNSFSFAGSSISDYSGAAYFGQRLGVAESLSARQQAPSRFDSLMALQPLSGRQSPLSDQRSLAILQKVSATGERWKLTAGFASVDSAFSDIGEIASRSPQAKELSSMVGKRSLNWNLESQPLRGFSLTSRFDRLTNDQPGNSERGLTKTTQSHSLSFQLSPATKLAFSLDAQEQRRQNGSDDGTTTKTLSLSQELSSHLRASVARQLVGARAGGSVKNTEITSAKLNYALPKLSFDAEVSQKKAGEGGGERLVNFAAKRSGAISMSFSGQVKNLLSADGKTGKEQKWAASLSRGDRLHLTGNYESLRQPGSDSQNAKTDVKLTVKMIEGLNVSAEAVQNQEGGTTTNMHRLVRLDIQPKPFSLDGGVETELNSQGAQVQRSFGSLLFDRGRALETWAQETSSPGFLPGSDKHGVRTSTPWAALPPRGLALRFLSSPQEQDTRMAGYQTMLGHSLYLRAAFHENPIEKKDGKEQVVRVNRSLVELGARLGSKWSLLARQLGEKDLAAGSSCDTRVVALKGRLSPSIGLWAGVQAAELQGAATAQDGAAQNQAAHAGMKFVSASWRMGTALQPWAREAMDKNLFADSDKWGYRRRPEWLAQKPFEGSPQDSGLHVTWFGRDGAQSTSGQAGGSHLAYLQTMLGRNAYLELSQRLRLADNQGNTLLEVKRSEGEFGMRFARKWTGILRLTHETDPAAGGGAKVSSLASLRSCLSAREKVEGTVVLDRSSSGQYSRERSYGLEYSREIDPDHFLALKGLVNDKDATSSDSREYHLDVAYRKAI